MKNVIADMILESDAALNLAMRVARSVDCQEQDDIIDSNQDTSEPVTAVLPVTTKFTDFKV